jgi:hypothetical protein
MTATVIFKTDWNQAPGALTYNLSYLGGRDQEDHGSRPAWGKVCDAPSPKQGEQNGLEVWLQCFARESPALKPSPIPKENLTKELSPSSRTPA